MLTPASRPRTSFATAALMMASRQRPIEELTSDICIPSHPLLRDESAQQFGVAGFGPAAASTRASAGRRRLPPQPSPFWIHHIPSKQNAVRRQRIRCRTLPYGSQSFSAIAGTSTIYAQRSAYRAHPDRPRSRRGGRAVDLYLLPNTLKLFIYRR